MVVPLLKSLEFATRAGCEVSHDIRYAGCFPPSHLKPQASRQRLDQGLQSRGGAAVLYPKQYPKPRQWPVLPLHKHCLPCALPSRTAVANSLSFSRRQPSLDGTSASKMGSTHMIPPNHIPELQTSKGLTAELGPRRLRPTFRCLQQWRGGCS